MRVSKPCPIEASAADADEAAPEDEQDAAPETEKASAPAAAALNSL
jgi:hypothetical protein